MAMLPTAPRSVAVLRVISAVRRERLGGVKTKSMDLVDQARRPVTSGGIMAMFAAA